MRGFTATVAVLVVAVSLAAAIPTAAVGDRALADPTEPNSPDANPLGTDFDGDLSGDFDANATGETDARLPPELPEQWRQTYGGDADDIFSDLVRTDDGGYLVVGWTDRETIDGWVMKINGDGEQVWERTLGGSGTDRFWGVAKTDAGYLLAGRTDADGSTSGWIVELNADGEIREERTAGSGAFNAIARDDSGENSGYLLAGWASSDEGRALKLDDDLSREWQQSYPTPDGYEDGFLRAIVPVESGEQAGGGYYLAGKIEGDSDDAWALKVDSEGSLEWQTTAGSPNRDEAWAAAPGSSGSANDSGSPNGASSADGGFVLAGEIGVDTDDRSGWLVKFDADGSVAWERTPGNGALWFDSAMKTEDGYLFTGSGDAGPTGTTDGYVLETDANGTARWDGYYATQGWDKPWPAVRAHDSGYLLAGQTGGDDGGAKDGWLVRIGTDSEANGTGDGNPDDTTDGTASGTDTTDSAIQAGTSTTGDAPGGEGGVPGMGVGAALPALVVALLLARR
jgi:hypothetical protein